MKRKSTILPANLIKYLLLFPVTLFCLAPAFSQKDRVLNLPRYDNSPYHFGFLLGVNQMHFTIRPATDLHVRMFDSTYLPDILPTPDSALLYSVESSPYLGFTVGIIGNLRMGKYFDLRFIPSLSFGERELHYSLMTFTNGDTAFIPVSKRVPSTFIDFPLLIKYKSARLNNLRAYLLGGAKYSLDLASQAKKREQKNLNQKIVKIKANDLYLVAGVGFDFYNEWFKLGVEITMSYCLSDILKREKNIYTDGIDYLRSKVFQLSFTFE